MPVSEPSVAVITVVPVEPAMAIPVEDPIVAVEVVPDVQVTVPVGGRVVPSLRSSTTL